MDDGGTVGFDPLVLEAFINKPKELESLTVREFRDLFAALKNIQVPMEIAGRRGAAARAQALLDEVGQRRSRVS